MSHAAEFLRCMEDLDSAGIRRLWAHVSPELPQPKTDVEALFALHHARTQSDAMDLKARAYSHRWLVDNGYPSGLPDELKPNAERLYPVVAEGVGISVNARSELMRPVVGEIRAAMQHAVEDVYASSRNPDVALVKSRMRAAREYTTRKLTGRMGFKA